MVLHNSIRKYNHIHITLIPTISIEISLAELFSPAAVNVYAKIHKQQLLKAFWWYYTILHLGLYSTSPVFFIYNRNRKFRIFLSRLTFNVALKQPLVKLRFSCTEIFFNPLNNKIKPMLQYFILSLKQVFYFRFFRFSSSEPIFYDES